MAPTLSRPSVRPRRRRHVPSPPGRPLALTPVKVELLRYLLLLGFATTPQLSRLTGCERAVRHLRSMLDGGLVRTIPVARVCLLAPSELARPDALYGSAPTVHTLTGQGYRALRELGLDGGLPPPGRWEPKGWMFLGHELAVRGAFVWLSLCARGRGDRLERWSHGEEAALPRGRPAVRPDALAIYRLADARVMVCLLEIDRGTESASRWKSKLEGYSSLFSGGGLKEAIGFSNARIVTIAPDPARRDRLAGWTARDAPAIAGRCWFADRSVMHSADLSTAAWRRPGIEGLHPLLALPASSERTRGSGRPGPPTPRG